MHFDKALTNTSFAATCDQSIPYRGAGAKATVYVQVCSAAAVEGTRAAELKRASAMLLNPALTDPWPTFAIGPFAVKFFLSNDDMTVVGVAVTGR